MLHIAASASDAVFLAKSQKEFFKKACGTYFLLKKTCLGIRLNPRLTFEGQKSNSPPSQGPPFPGSTSIRCLGNGQSQVVRVMVELESIRF